MAAHPTYLDAGGLARSRKGTGAAGTEADPDVTIVRVESTVAATQSGAWSVTITGSALPTGAATEATLAAIAGYLDTEVAAIVTALQILDDWDESDRAKVNPIAGQAGVQGGSGVVTALTQRVVLATDVTPPLPADAATETTLAAIAGYLDTETAALVTAAQIIDDWDESDRAKVNLIVGQAGIAAGAGAVGVTTPRFTLASDDPAVANLATLIGHLDGVEGALTTIAGYLDTETGAIVTAVELLDDTIYADGATFSGGSSKVQSTGLLYDDSVENVATGKIGIARMTADRRSLVNEEESSGYVYIDGVRRTVERFNVGGATSGNLALIAADASNKFRVLSLKVFAGGAVDVYVNDGTADLLGNSTQKIKLDNTGAVGALGLVLARDRDGHFQTGAVNRPLNLNLSANVNVFAQGTFARFP